MIDLRPNAVRFSKYFWCLTFAAIAGLVSNGSFAQMPGQLEDPAAATVTGDAVPGQQGGSASLDTTASISGTSLTSRGHQIGAGASLGSLEGNACAAGTTMISGACHPGYSDRVIIINQFPNKATNTWRCGFKNNTGATRTVWVYTLCAQ